MEQIKVLITLPYGAVWCGMMLALEIVLHFGALSCK